jgi:hypothetical protein
MNRSLRSREGSRPRDPSFAEAHRSQYRGPFDCLTACTSARRARTRALPGQGPAHDAGEGSRPRDPSFTEAQRSQSRDHSMSNRLHHLHGARGRAPFRL